MFLRPNRRQFKSCADVSHFFLFQIQPGGNKKLVECLRYKRPLWYHRHIRHGISGSDKFSLRCATTGQLLFTARIATCWVFTQCHNLQSGSVTEYQFNWKRPLEHLKGHSKPWFSGRWLGGRLTRISAKSFWPISHVVNCREDICSYFIKKNGVSISWDVGTYMELLTEPERLILQELWSECGLRHGQCEEGWNLPFLPGSEHEGQRFQGYLANRQRWGGCNLHHGMCCWRYKSQSYFQIGSIALGPWYQNVQSKIHLISISTRPKCSFKLNVLDYKELYKTVDNE